MAGVGTEFWVFCWLCTYGSDPAIPSPLFIGMHTENRMRVSDHASLIIKLIYRDIIMGDI